MEPEKSVWQRVHFEGKSVILCLTYEIILIANVALSQNACSAGDSLVSFSAHLSRIQ